MISTDVVQSRRFTVGLDTPNPAFNEQQRADCAPRSTLGDGVINSGDVVQTRRYATGLDPLTDAGGPTSPSRVPHSEIIDGIYAYLARREVGVGAVESENSATVTVPIEIVAQGNEMAIGFTLEYDADMLGEPQVILADGAPADAVLTVNYKEKGLLGILVDSPEPFVPGEGPMRFVNVTFTVFKRGETTIRVTGDLAPTGISDKNGDLLVTRWRNGLFRIN